MDIYVQLQKSMLYEYTTKEEQGLFFEISDSWSLQFAWQFAVIKSIVLNCNEI
jgi:hypothetical protein